jgi:hypothetical protein
MDGSAGEGLGFRGESTINPILFREKIDRGAVIFL